MGKDKSSNHSHASHMPTPLAREYNAHISSAIPVVCVQKSADVGMIISS